MKKLPIILLFALTLVVSCQAVNENKIESVLVYSCDPSIQNICYRDLISDQPEVSFPFQEYYFIKCISPDQVLLSQDVGPEYSDEYSIFDLKANSFECITCNLNSVSSKVLSPSMHKVAVIDDTKLSIVDLSSPDQVESSLSDMSFFWADWSPDDSFLVFTDESMHMYRFNLKDQSLIELLPEVSAMQIFDVEISPRGDKIAFYLLDEDQNFSLSAVSADGTGLQVLADLTPKTKKYIDSENASTSFTWSPTGKQIAFTAHLEDYPDYRSGLFIVDLDGMRPKLILDSPTIKFSPVWSPDGSLIAFVDQGHPSQDIWTIAPNGTSLTNQTNTPKRDEYAPGWK